MKDGILTDLFRVPIEDLPRAHFDGATYQPDRDQVRLSGQLQRVADAMADRRWHTLEELSRLAQAPAQSVSARIRDLRKPKFGAFEIHHRVKAGCSGTWEYRLVDNQETRA